MATSITYGSYSFPEPIPLLAEEDEPVILGGEYDHSAIRVNLVGYFTGSNLQELDLKRMQMVSGFLNEYQDLTITVENESKTCPKAYLESISFGESDLTTFLPYNLSALYYSGETFSNYFKVAEPENSWSYVEGENKIITATHSVSARGLKVDSNSAFDNARYFVTGNLYNGFEQISLFNDCQNAFLTSRTEDINRKNDTYAVKEVYTYSASDDPISNVGVVSADASITHDLDGGLSISVQGNVQGDISANTGSQVGLLSTGDFTPAQATEIALNSIVNSYSDYESGKYSFVLDGPSTFNYDLDTGANNLSFSFSFLDADNLDIINGDVVHSFSSSIGVSKDSPTVNISIEGELKYNGVSFVNATGEFEDNIRFSAVESAFSQVDPYLIAKSSIEDFRGVATGYELSSSYLNDTPLSYNITKDPIANILTYSYSFDNSVDFSTGKLDNFSLSIEDNVPIQLQNVVETISGVRAATVAKRTLGVYSLSASSQNKPELLDELKRITSLYCSGDHKISESYSTGDNTISYNLSKYY